MERSDVRKARMEREGHLSHWDPAVAELIDSAKAERDEWKDRYHRAQRQRDQWKESFQGVEAGALEWRDAYFEMSKMFNAAAGTLGLSRTALIKALCEPNADNPLPDGGKWVEPMGDFQ